MPSISHDGLRRIAQVLNPIFHFKKKKIQNQGIQIPKPNKGCISSVHGNKINEIRCEIKLF